MELIGKYLHTTNRIVIVLSVIAFVVALVFFGLDGIRKSNETKSLDYFRNEYERCITEKKLTKEFCGIYQKMVIDTPMETQRYFNIGLYILLIYFPGLFIYSTVHNKSHFFIGFALILGFTLGVIWIKREVWTGFYYPNIDKIDDQRTWIISPPLYSLDECRKWANAVHKSGEDNYDYSCGQGCRFTTDYIGETMICRTDTR